MKAVRGGILMLYSRPFAFRDAATIREHIGSFRRHSRFDVCPINTIYGFPPTLRDWQFDVIVMHYTLFASAHYGLGQRWLEYIDGCRESYKITFFQDEYYACPTRFAFLRNHKINCVYTLLDEVWGPRVYSDHTGIEMVVPTLAGYVSKEMLQAAQRFALPDSNRSIDIGYRTRPLSPYMGKSAREKTHIAEETLRRCQGLDLVLDIETEEHHRLYGKAWYQFLGQCRACIGVEAGVSVFDLDGSVYSRYRELRELYPQASFEEMVRRLEPVMSPEEGRIFYRTVSPRHFEAAAFGITQILFEGRYSGVLDEERHYISLKKDFSNFDEVIARFRSKDARSEITQAAWRDLIDSGAYSYERFINGFDRVLESCGLSPVRKHAFSKLMLRSNAVRPDVVASFVSRVLLEVMRRLYGWTQRSPFARRFVVPIIRPVMKPLVRLYKKRRQL